MPSARSRSIIASGRSETRPKPAPPPTNISTTSPFARSTAALLRRSSTVPLARKRRQEPPAPGPQPERVGPPLVADDAEEIVVDVERFDGRVGAVAERRVDRVAAVGAL